MDSKWHFLAERRAEAKCEHGFATASRRMDSTGILVALRRPEGWIREGALEVVRLDAQQQPTELVFVPLDDLRGVVLASPAIFRLAKLFFDDGRPDEIVLVPMIYGISWSTSNAVHHDGSLTTFVAHVQRRGEAQARGIGLGHQDFVVSGDGARLMGLGAIGEIMVALSVDDPRFDQKCRARGLDPAVVRRESTRKQ